MFPKSQDGTFNALFCPQLKDICLTVTEERRNQKIFKKVELDDFYPNPTAFSKRLLKPI